MLDGKDLIDRGVDPDTDFDIPCCPWCGKELLGSDDHVVTPIQVAHDEYEYDLDCLAVPKKSQGIIFEFDEITARFKIWKMSFTNSSVNVSF